MHNIKKLIIFTLISMSSLSCAINPAASDISKYNMDNWMYIHPNPKLGDYAVLEDKKYNHSIRFEITEVKENTVKVKYTRNIPSQKNLQDISFLLTVTKQGNILSSNLKQISTGRIYPQNIAKKGESAWVNVYEKIPSKTKDKISTMNLDIPITSYHIMNMLIDDGPGGKLEVYGTNYINSNIPFGNVKRVVYFDADFTLIRISEFINTYLEYKLNPAKFINNSYLRFITNLIDKPEERDERTGIMVLADYHKVK